MAHDDLLNRDYAPMTDAEAAAAVNDTSLPTLRELITGHPDMHYVAREYLDNHPDASEYALRVHLEGFHLMGM